MKQYVIDSENYYAVKLNEVNIIDLVYLFKHCFNETLTEAELLERHSLCHGNVKFIGFIAYQIGTNEIAAYYGVFPTLLSYNGNTYLVAQSGDTMTHPKHQKKGLFVKLANLTFQFCNENGIELIFGFPNENSYPGFVRNLGFLLPPAMGAFTLVENKFELTRFSEKIPFLHKIHLKYINLVVKIFTQNGEEFLSSNNTGLETAGIFRDSQYFKQKSHKPTQIRKIWGKNIWFQVYSNRMIIGDLEASTASDLKKIILRLKLITLLSGFRFVTFKMTPNAFWFQIIKDLGFIFREINPVILKNLHSKIPFEKIAFTNSDIDVF
jgi:hypothetical protein